MKMDFMSSLEKETYDDKVGETMSKSDYRPLLDGKDGAKGSGERNGQWGGGSWLGWGERRVLVMNVQIFILYFFPMFALTTSVWGRTWTLHPRCTVE